MTQSTGALQAITDDAWPPEKIALLTLMVETGVGSFVEIGAALDKTKNAAIGKARRLDLTGPRSRGPLVGREPLTLDERLARLDLFPGFGRCAFPVGDPGVAGFRFCGDHATEGHAYCPTHHGQTHIKGSAD